MEKIDKYSLVYLAGASVFYGLLIVLQKMGLNSGLEPVQFSFFRSIVVVFISLVFFHPLLKNVKKIQKCEWWELILLALVSTSTILVSFLGQQQTTATNAGFLIRLTPLFVIPLGYIILKDRISVNSVFYMLLMLGGVFLLTTGGVAAIPGVGDLLMISVAFFIAFQNVFAKRIMRGVPSEVVVFFRVFASSALIVLFAFAFLDLNGGNILTAGGLFYIFASGLLYFLSVLFQYRAINRVGPFLTTTFFLSGSLFSAFFAYLLLGEALSLIQWIGAAAILAGGLLTVRKRMVLSVYRKSPF